jgi:methylase of polypeptide subunit release factors
MLVALHGLVGAYDSAPAKGSYVRALPRVDDTEAVELLRETLGRAEYNAAGLLRLLDPERAVPAADRTFQTLLKLLYLGVGATPEEVAAAFAPLSVERLEAMGVLDGGVPLVEIVPLGRVLVASDPERETQRSDRVPGPSKSSRILAAVTPRTRVARAVDLGTGCGVQALLLAEHAAEVVATDVNPRALEFAAFNAALNGLTTIDLREGSLFEPVAGEQFDLVVSNPPYVISPDSIFAYRDAGVPGDAFSEAVVRQAPGFLREGGFAHVAVNWVMARGEPPVAAPTAWIGGLGCDAVVLHTSTWSALDYAASWNSLLRVDPIAYGHAVDRWLTHFERSGIERIGGGIVVLRRRSSGGNWVLAFDTADPQPGAGAHLQRLFAAQDYLSGRDDEALLDASFVPAGDHVLELRLRSGSVLSARALLVGGLGLGADLDQAAADLLGRLEAGRTLREVGGESAAPTLRHFLKLGLAEPA